LRAEVAKTTGRAAAAEEESAQWKVMYELEKEKRIAAEAEVARLHHQLSELEEHHQLDQQRAAQAYAERLEKLQDAHTKELDQLHKSRAKQVGALEKKVSVQSRPSDHSGTKLEKCLQGRGQTPREEGKEHGGRTGCRNRAGRYRAESTQECRTGKGASRQTGALSAQRIEPSGCNNDKDKWFDGEGSRRGSQASG
jgi:hypothetical protein